MLVSNENKYVFLSNEIAKHPELEQWTPEELFAKESDFDFWDELSEHLDSLRICDACNRPMIEGYCIDDGQEHYCSDDCLHSYYSEEEYIEMSDDEKGNSYWTVWWE